MQAGLKDLWVQLSEGVQTARVCGQLDESNQALRNEIPRLADEGFAAALRLWLADNLMYAMRYDEAVAAYQDIVDSHPELTFTGKDDGYAWAAYALERAASCQEKRGNIDGALVSLSTVLAEFPKGRPVAQLHYRMGRLLEAAGRDKEAVDAYGAASSTDAGEPGGDWPLGEFAKHQSASLQRRGGISVHRGN